MGWNFKPPAALTTMRRDGLGTSTVAETWGFHEEIDLHRAFDSGVTQLGLRRSSGIPYDSTAGSWYANHFLAGRFADFQVDWHGGHAAICGDCSSFRWDYAGHEHFGGVEFLGSRGGSGERKRTRQRCGCGNGNDQRANRKLSCIRESGCNWGSGRLAVDHDIAGRFFHAGPYQPAVHGDGCVQRRKHRRCDQPGGVEFYIDLSSQHQREWAG